MDEEAKAIKELAVTAGKAIDATTDAVRFLAKVLGSVPEDIIGLGGGDILREIRRRNKDSLERRTEEIIAERNAIGRIRPVSPNIAIPIIEAASNESHSELQEIWARLLASAMDSKRSEVRQSFIEALKKMDPLDARVIVFIVKHDDLTINIDHTALPAELGVSADSVEVSLSQLQKIGCLEFFNEYHRGDDGAPMRVLLLTVFGRELIRALAI